MSIIKGVLTTASQVSISMAAGDVVSQYLENCDKRDPSKGYLEDIHECTNVDWPRTSRMALAGLCVSGPWSHGLYHGFEKLVPGSHNAAIAKKVLGGMALAPVSITLLFSFVQTLKGESEAIAEKIEKDLLDTWVTGSVYWPAVMALNFKFVPLGHRPLVGALSGSAWSIYSSYQANKRV